MKVKKKKTSKGRNIHKHFSLFCWHHHTTYPGSDLTLPEPALLSDFVWPSKLLHVLTEVTLSTVLCSSAGLTFSTHSDRALHLRTITQ